MVARMSTQGRFAMLSTGSCPDMQAVQRYLPSLSETWRSRCSNPLGAFWNPKIGGWWAGLQARSFHGLSWPSRRSSIWRISETMLEC